MNLTTTEFLPRPCSKCGGARFISQFQHRKGGECFRCGASGIDPQMIAVTRDLTDQEVLASLADAGFPVVFTDEPDGFMGLFLSPAQVDAHAAAMAGARTFLAAL